MPQYLITSPLSYNGTQYAIGAIAELPAEVGDKLTWCCAALSPAPVPVVTPESDASQDDVVVVEPKEQAKPRARRGKASKDSESLPGGKADG